MNGPLLLECQWDYLRSFLPSEQELARAAAERGAVRRWRAVQSASALLRLALAYGFCGLTLRQTAAWAQLAQVATLSDVALLKRLRAADGWLGHVLGLKLAERAPLPSGPNDLGLRLVDATTVSEPGSRGTDWRIHLGFNLKALAVDHVELTDGKGGETLRRFPVRARELVVGDRGYADRRSFEYVRAAGAYFLVRLNWQNVPLQTPAGERFDLLAFLRGLPEATAQEAAVQVAPSERAGVPAFPARLVAVRKSEVAAEAARAEILRERARKQETLDPRTLETAAYTFLLTTAPAAQLSTLAALDTYRFRWQIELAFKRMKSLLHLAALPARDPPLARSALYAKLLGALLLEDFTRRFLAFSPWGFRLPDPSPFALADSVRVARRPPLRDPGRDHA